MFITCSVKHPYRERIIFNLGGCMSETFKFARIMYTEQWKCRIHTFGSNVTLSQRQQYWRWKHCHYQSTLFKGGFVWLKWKVYISEIGRNHLIRYIRIYMHYPMQFILSTNGYDAVIGRNEKCRHWFLMKYMLQYFTLESFPIIYFEHVY